MLDFLVHQENQVWLVSLEGQAYQDKLEIQANKVCEGHRVRKVNQEIMDNQDSLDQLVRM